MSFHRNLGSKVVCSVCGATGFEGGRWQEKCKAGHPEKCACGKAYPKGLLKQHISATRWPERAVVHYRI